MRRTQNHLELNKKIDLNLLSYTCNWLLYSSYSAVWMYIVHALEACNLIFHSPTNPLVILHLDCLSYKMMLVELNDNVYCLGQLYVLKY